MMFARRIVLPLVFLALAGCDRITGADQQKALDAEAIGYSCRISLKPPEDCMKENDTHSPTSILYGWKEADRDVKERAIDPSMGKSQPAPSPPPSTPAAAEDKTAKPPEAATAPKGEAAPATGKTDKGATERKTAP